MNLLFFPSPFGSITIFFYFLYGAIFGIFFFVAVGFYLFVRYGLTEPTIKIDLSKLVAKSKRTLAQKSPLSLNESSDIAEDPLSVIKSGWLRITTTYNVESYLNYVPSSPDKNSDGSSLNSNNPSVPSATVFSPPSSDSPPLSMQSAVSPSNMIIPPGFSGAGTINKDTSSIYAWVVLRSSSLFFYESEHQKSCFGVASIEECEVLLVPPDLRLDLYYRRDYPIKISSHNGTVFARSSSIYLFAPSAIDKEDWYLLMQEAIQKKNDPTSYRSLHINGFMQSLSKSVKNPLLDQHSQWFNALFGRIFYNVFESVELQDYFMRKFNRKTSRLKVPFFLTDISIGNQLPLISNAMLHSIDERGSVHISMDMHYIGNFKVQIETEAKIELPRVKAFYIPLILAVQIKKLSGKMLFMVKPPPSDRLWFGFYKMPELELAIEPVVSTRAIKFSLVRSAIEKRLIESLEEYLVLPNMEEIGLPPLKSRFEDERAGIKSDAGIKFPLNQPDKTYATVEQTSLTSALMSLPRKKLAQQRKNFKAGEAPPLLQSEEKKRPPPLPPPRFSSRNQKRRSSTQLNQVENSGETIRPDPSESAVTEEGKEVSREKPTVTEHAGSELEFSSSPYSDDTQVHSPDPVFDHARSMVNLISERKSHSDDDYCGKFHVTKKSLQSYNSCDDLSALKGRTSSLAKSPNSENEGQPLAETLFTLRDENSVSESSDGSSHSLPSSSPTFHREEDFGCQLPAKKGVNMASGGIMKTLKNSVTTGMTGTKKRIRSLWSFPTAPSTQYHSFPSDIPLDPNFQSQHQRNYLSNLGKSGINSAHIRSIEEEKEDDIDGRKDTEPDQSGAEDEKEAILQFDHGNI